MGTRGPVPNQNARRRNKREVKAAVISDAPSMPSGLPAEAQAEWDRIVPLLEEMGILTVVDRALLLRYCKAWAEYLELDDQVSRTGRLVKGQKGEYVRNPLWLMRRDVERSLNDMSAQMGLTPAARLRAGIKHDRPERDDELPESVKAIEDFRKRMGA